MFLETMSTAYQVMRNSAIYCYLSSLDDSAGVGSLSIRDQYGEKTGVNVSIPETLTLYYKDVYQISIVVTSGIVAWTYPPSQEIV